MYTGGRGNCYYIIHLFLLVDCSRVVIPYIVEVR